MHDVRVPFGKVQLAWPGSPSPCKLGSGLLPPFLSLLGDMGPPGHGFLLVVLEVKSPPPARAHSKALHCGPSARTNHTVKPRLHGAGNRLCPRRAKQGYVAKGMDTGEGHGEQPRISATGACPGPCRWLDFRDACPAVAEPLAPHLDTRSLTPQTPRTVVEEPSPDSSQRCLLLSLSLTHYLHRP